jgi:hypothetical protein
MYACPVSAPHCSSSSPDTCGPHPHEHLHEVRPADGQEWDTRLHARAEEKVHNEAQAGCMALGLCADLTGMQFMFAVLRPLVKGWVSRKPAGLQQTQGLGLQ